MRPLKIGVSCFSTFGGSGIVATALGRALARRGHTVHFIGHEPPRRLHPEPPHLIFHPVPTAGPPHPEAGDGLALAAALTAVATRERLDLLHAHYAVPHALAAWLARTALGGTPRLVSTLHGTDITALADQPGWRPLLRQCIGGSDAVTAPSRFLAEEAQRQLGLEQPVEVVANFVDTEVFRPAQPHERQGLFDLMGSEEPVFVHVSNFRPVKRVAAVVEVFRHLVAQRPARLLLIGDGPDRAAVEAQLGDLAGRVHVLGRQTHFEPLLRACTGFLLPSASESFGLAALEALASGVPVVASAVGGLPEVVRDGETGWLLPPDDLAGMAARALMLLEPARQRAMAAAARSDAVERFSETPLVDRYEALFERVVHG